MRARDSDDVDRVLLAARLVAGACVLTAASLAAAQDESVEQFYKGKQVQIVVGSSAGGGYDTYARLLARHLGDHIPGNPSVVVQNMSGAGSNRAAGYIYSVAHHPADLNGVAENRDELGDGERAIHEAGQEEPINHGDGCGFGGREHAAENSAENDQDQQDRRARLDEGPEGRPQGKRDGDVAIAVAPGDIDAPRP